MVAIDNVFEIRAYSLKELAIIYGISRKTFKRWIIPFFDEIGERQGRYYNVAQVKIIFNKLGVPFKITQESVFD